jgi:hypothetical protein
VRHTIMVTNSDRGCMKAQLCSLSGSIMHYQNDAFSNNGQPTIRSILKVYENWERQMGRGKNMSS